MAFGAGVPLIQALGLTARHDLLVEEILEFRAALLESGGVDVGQVVGNHVDIQGLGLHPRCGGP